MTSDATILEPIMASLSSDTSSAVSDARNAPNVEAWIRSAMMQAAAVGGIAMAIPGAHLPALVWSRRELAFLLHRVAYGSWGVGELRGCAPLGKSDLLNILALWVGTPLSALPHRAIKKATLQKALRRGETHVDSLSISRILSLLSEEQARSFGIDPDTITPMSQQRTADFGLSSDVQTRIVQPFASKLGGKVFSGFVPLVGAIVGASINAYLLRDILNAADEYYFSGRLSAEAGRQALSVFDCS